MPKTSCKWALKRAQKRAQMGAVLNFGFSQYFTVDLEDPGADEREPVEQPKRKSEAGKERPADNFISQAQVKRAYAIACKRAEALGDENWDGGSILKSVCAEYGIESSKEIPRDKYDEIIAKVEAFGEIE